LVFDFAAPDNARAGTAVEGSNPFAPTLFRNEPFGEDEDVEGLSRCGDESYNSVSVFNLLGVTRVRPIGFNGVPFIARRYAVQITPPVWGGWGANLYFCATSVIGDGAKASNGSAALPTICRRIERDMSAILRVLAEHSRMLERLPEAVGE
jgi:hypothetical protein